MYLSDVTSATAARSTLAATPHLSKNAAGYNFSLLYPDITYAMAPCKGKVEHQVGLSTGRQWRSIDSHHRSHDASCEDPHSKPAMPMSGQGAVDMIIVPWEKARVTHGYPQHQAWPCTWAQAVPTTWPRSLLFVRCVHNHSCPIIDPAIRQMPLKGTPACTMRPPRGLPRGAHVQAQQPHNG